MTPNPHAKAPQALPGDVPSLRCFSGRLGASLAMFFFVWLTAGMAINSADLRAFLLHQSRVQALVERGHFYLDQRTSKDKLPDLGETDYGKLSADIFVFGGHIYPAKQPGQFLAGALAYAPLRALGITYDNNYLLASALVTFFTASLVFAISSAVVFHLARTLVNPAAGALSPWMIALIYATATTVAAYSGVAHHDVIACGFLTCAAALAYEVWKGHGRAVPIALGAGLLLGLTVTTSMLAAPAAVLIGGGLLAMRRWRVLLPVCAGVIAGLTPLLIVNAVSFGNPFLAPNIAGDYDDTFFRIDLHNTIQKSLFYGSMLIAYVPVLAVGIAGLFCFPVRLRVERWLLVSLLAVNVFTIVSISSFGGCQVWSPLPDPHNGVRMSWDSRWQLRHGSEENGVPHAYRIDGSRLVRHQRLGRARRRHVLRTSSVRRPRVLVRDSSWRLAVLPFGLVLGGSMACQRGSAGDHHTPCERVRQTRDRVAAARIYRDEAQGILRVTMQTSAQSANSPSVELLEKAVKILIFAVSLAIPVWLARSDVLHSMLKHPVVCVLSTAS